MKRARHIRNDGRSDGAGLEAVTAVGKYFRIADRPWPVRGVTYGTFLPGADGEPFPARGTVRDDFERMSHSGFNCVRTYTVPPRWLLDVAGACGLRILVGLAWEQHVAFLDDALVERRIRSEVAAGVEACAGHPAVLGYALGNEIPASIVRWHGGRRIERFLHRLYRIAKTGDPTALVTYVNYPTTEYLQLPFLDFVAFNVFLEDHADFQAYLGRLQNLAGDRPLVVAEMGLDSRRGGIRDQAALLDRQLRVTFETGCAGAFVFAWTDDWARTGEPVDDWDFGLVDRHRRPKPALAAVRRAFEEAPGELLPAAPSASVVVCTYNGAATLGECLDGLTALEYPDYEVIVVDDGSTDDSREIAARYPVSVITTENRGLSHARNVGLGAARGELVAYIDDDAHPDPHWLLQAAAALGRGDFAGVGGPNIPPGDESTVARCVAAAPGGPMHVLVSDDVAEHIPGCNMVFRRDALLRVGGFDPRFRIAGDDVDLCWRLQSSGDALGFAPGAVVWHRRRNSVRAYLRQQYEYGKAEAQLERKWPHRYNRMGHLAWSGTIYGAASPARRGGRVRYGTWGSGLFQPLYRGQPSLLASLVLSPEWYLVLAVVAVVSALGAVWQPLLAAAPLLVVGLAAMLAEAVRGGRRAPLRTPGVSRPRELAMRALVVALHLAQPAARLAGRLRHGLSPWRRSGGRSLAAPVPYTRAEWCEEWRSASARLGAMEQGLADRGHVVVRGGDFDRWDVHVRGGMLGGARLRLALEEHGRGHQLVRFRVWPHASRAGLLLSNALALLAVGAALAGGGPATAVLAAAAVWCALTVGIDCALAQGAITNELAAPPAVRGDQHAQPRQRLPPPEGVGAGAPADRRVHGA